ncbi:MAG: bifunctional DNA primase/polymerase [Clostridia bacterium]|nr:bifunctional DNA primase/polymerase [Clostridia bacterium]
MIDLIEKLFPNSQYKEVYLKNDPRAERAGISHKAPINNQILTYSQIKNTPNRIGWIVPEGYTVVDIDNKRCAKKIQMLLMGEGIDTIIFETEHGCHFCFKSIAGVFQTQGTFCRLGIKIDTRSNASGYIVIPYNDADRRVVQTANKIPNLPQYLLPEKIDCPDMSTVSEGERNGKLFEFMTKLKFVKSITTEQIKECVNLCNKYILDSPIPQKELDKTVLSQKNLERGTDASKISSNTIANEILQEVKLITTRQGMYMFNGKYYETCDDFQLARYIHAKYAEFNSSKRDEIIEFIKLKTYQPADNINSDWRKITLRNGVLNLMTGELSDFDPNCVMTRYIDIEFIPDCPASSRIENFLNGLSGYTPGIENQVAFEKKQKLLEFIGYCLVSRNKFQKVFFLLGPGATGKSTFLELVRKLFQPHNCSALSMQDLESTFMPAQLKDKIVNIGDDISINTLLDGSTIKILCGTLPIMVQQKYERPYEMVNEAKFIFSCNKMPLFKDKTDGLYRRLEILEITNRIAPSQRKSGLIDTFTHEDLQYLLWQAFLAINKALVNDRLIDTICCAEALERFRTQSSTLLMFIKQNSQEYHKPAIDFDEMRSKLNGMTISKAYYDYSAWCAQNGKSKQSIETFTENICLELDMSINKGHFAANVD